jgi:hypothetical protein
VAALCLVQRALACFHHRTPRRTARACVTCCGRAHTTTWACACRCSSDERCTHRYCVKMPVLPLLWFVPTWLPQHRLWVRTELFNGSSGCDDTGASGVSDLLLRALELGLEVEDGDSADTLDCADSAIVWTWVLSYYCDYVCCYNPLAKNQLAKGWTHYALELSKVQPKFIQIFFTSKANWANYSWNIVHSYQTKLKPNHDKTIP